MTENCQYFAITDWQRPGTLVGIARRRELLDGGLIDEGLNREIKWQRTSLIVEWERAESTNELKEISEMEAEQVIEQLRRRWSALD